MLTEVVDGVFRPIEPKYAKIEKFWLGAFFVWSTDFGELEEFSDCK